MKLEQIGKLYKGNGARIGDMLPGDYGWTVPWAFEYDENLDITGVRLNYTLSDEGVGTSCVSVAMQKDGTLTVDLRRAAKWFGG